ncbi:DoxX family protein [Lentisphaera profundi]|uniref:DoxX family protein n=1 Tax=Lentisphaera profundi TaxID=1658616 RepID=A0ABY7VUK6_9BACT|nr:DoxX family protein [Lentisphaera profundi]WDE97893.1 DoxX family protein [Lentisphaera profundi]
MKHLKSYENSPLKPADSLIASLRIFVGLVLLWKGIGFFFDQNTFIQYFANIGEFWFAPVAWLHYVFLAHLFGGICLIGGMGTRWAALMQLPILIGAVLFIHPLNPHLIANTGETALATFTLMLLTFFAVRGSGIYSIDHKMAVEEDQEQHPHAVQHA